MSNSTDMVYEMFKWLGKFRAEQLQSQAPSMTATQIIEEENYIPNFNPTKQYLNYAAGYVCKDSDGNVWKLLQPYDSSIYTAEPSDSSMAAMWAPYWTTNPKKAKKFIALSTAPYMEGDCCWQEIDGVKYTFKSVMDNNVWAPNDVGRARGNTYWLCLGKTEDIENGNYNEQGIDISTIK